MTCDDFRRICSSDPRDHTNAEVMGIVRHRLDCPECCRWLRETAEEDKKHYTPEEDALSKEVARAVVKRVLIARKVDPEL